MFSEQNILEIDEAFLKAKDHAPNYTKRNVSIVKDNNVLAVLKFPDGHVEPHITFNLVVTTGDQYYAQLVGQVTPTNDFDTMAVTNGATAIPAADDDFSDLSTADVNGDPIKVLDGVPTLNNNDAANTGKGVFVFTWKVTYLTTDFNTDTKANVTDGMITPATPSGTDPVLNHWQFTPFAKPSTAALIVWVNHTFVGA